MPEDPYTGSSANDHEKVDWAVTWLPEGGELVTESYVNLIPTSQDGTHVSGFRAGLTDALRDFCELRNLLPKGVKIAPDDVWRRCSFILSKQRTRNQSSGLNFSND